MKMDIPPKENKEENSTDESLASDPFSFENCHILSGIKTKDDLLKEIDRLNKIIEDRGGYDNFQNRANLVNLNMEKKILESKGGNIIDHPVYFYREPTVLKNRIIKHREYEDNYVPNLSDMGFEEGVLEKPKKWEFPELDKEAVEIDKINFDYKEFIEDAIDDKGNIKNGGSLFYDYFFKKVSPVLGEEKTSYYIDEYIPWKGEEIKNDLCEFINDDTIDKKDVEKIIAIKIIHDMVDYLAFFDERGITEAGSFVSNSLISRFKNDNGTILEKSFIKKNIYDILDLEKDNPGRYNISARYEKEEKAFLEKEIGAYYLAKSEHDKSFNNFKFSFSDDQIKAIEYPIFISLTNRKIKPKPVDYYEYNNLEKPKFYDGTEDLVDECYITSYIAPGVVGVYSIDGMLIGWKNVIDLKKDELNFINDISEIKKNNQMSMEDMVLFRVSSSLGFKNDIQRILSIDLSKIDLKNQFYFLNFIQRKTENDLINFKEFIKNSNNEEEKIYKLRTFLSIEQGGKEMGDKILTLGEKLPKESAKVLFAKYGEIIDEVDNIGGYIEKSMKGQVSALIIDKAKENLLIKGKDLLSSYAVKADVCNGEECIDLGKDLEEKLSNIKASLLLFASACKSLSENNSLSLEDLANTELEVIHGLSVDEETQKEMKRIFKENRPNYPDILLDDVSREFEDNLKNIKDNQTFYILKNNGDITSFMRLDEQKDGSVYGASFNVRTELRGSAIGSELLKKIIKKESSSRPFKIICYDKNPMIEKYKSDFGFDIVGVIDNYHNTGEKFYEMVREPNIK